MYRTSKIYKVESCSGNYKTKKRYYSFAMDNEMVMIFTTKGGAFGETELEKFWSLNKDASKKNFKMKGMPVDANKFREVFVGKRFFNHKTRTTEGLDLYPTKQKIIKMQIDREIEEMKTNKNI
jgi:hypothetical protein